MKNNQNDSVGLSTSNCEEIGSQSIDDKKLLSNRLNRIIGQVNGIKRMLDNNEYPTKILIQISAVTAALNSFGREVFKDYISNNVIEQLKQDDDSIVEELMIILKKMIEKN